MNATLAELYQGLILQHNDHPQNFGPLPAATHQATLHNALCGDQITLRLRLSSTDLPGTPVIAQACFEGESCALARASASLLTAAIVGKSPQQALALGDRLRAFLQPGGKNPPRTLDDPTRSTEAAELGDLVALQGVRDVPSRLRCATLPWEALSQSLHSK